MGKKLRIWHLGKFYPPAPGGIETHVATLARGQAELGAEVRVICVNHACRRGQDRTRQGWARTPTIEEWDGSVRVTRLGRWGSLAGLDYCPGILPLLQSLEAEGVDVLHLHVPNPTMLIPLALTSPRPRLFISYHSDIIRQNLRGKLLRPFEKRVFNQATGIFSDSPTYHAGSEFLCGYLKKIHVLPLGIDLKPYLRPSALALHYAHQFKGRWGSPLWLCVGRLVYYKGLTTALAALRHVPGHLLIIGTGPLEKELRQQAVQMGVADRVIWFGRASTEEVIGAYHAATALWFPSNARSEGFGLVQVEAMASGCPVINCAIPNSGVSWVSQHGQTGLTVPVNDSVALAAAANRLWTEFGLRECLAAAARHRVFWEFDQKLMARRSLQFYEEARERRRRKSVLPSRQCA